jgi:hypothetical protein
MSTDNILQSPVQLLHKILMYYTFIISLYIQNVFMKGSLLVILKLQV